MRSAILHGAAALATFALVLTSAPDAGAATVLTTATAVLPSSDGQLLACIVTNIDTKPITVTAQLFDPFSGAPETNVSNDCAAPGTLPPGIACVLLGSSNRGYCVVTTSSATARASLDVFNGTTAALEVHIPATK